MNGSDLPPGAPPVVKIDGEKIRRLRESKGLTQLYVATSVEVTTDTISRWENRRYPTIKKENALKLAEALEVLLADIEDTSTEETIPATKEPAQLETVAEPESPPLRRQAPWIALLATTIILVGVVAWFLLPGTQHSPLSAQRFLPPHAAPGQLFPVLIQVESGDNEPRSLIVKESFPADCEPVKGIPPFTALDPKRHFLKWISTAPGGHNSFAYLARVLPDAVSGKEVIFEGDVTLHKGRDGAGPVLGDDTLQIKGVHWADANGDMIVDDEEILAVYDLFGAIEGLDIDKEMIDKIWSGSGYRWEPEDRRFIVLP